MNKPTMELNRSERIEIFVSGLFTAGVISLIYLILYMLINSVMISPFVNNNSITRFKVWLLEGNYNILLDVLTLSYIIVLFATLIWQTRRRIQRVKLEHILDYIEYMGEGNFEERIPAEEAGRYESVAWNINQLMDSIEESIWKQNESERTKDELITNVGHDIRTPLTSVLGYLKLLDKQPDLDDQDRKQFTSIAYKKAKTMEVLVNDLFDYTKSMNTSLKLDIYSGIDIDEFFGQVISEFQIAAEKKNIELIAEVSPSDLQASFDPEKMARVFGNLVTNGLKYGKGASHICLTATYLNYEEYLVNNQEYINQKAHDKFKEIEGWIVCEVRNNGELVAEADLENIYERSYRGDSSRTSSEPGSGLGLSIVRNIVNLHGGHTFAHIQKDEMVFRVDIPQGEMNVPTDV